MGLLEIGLIIAVAVLLKQVFFVPETRNNQQQQQGNHSSSGSFCNDSRILELEKKLLQLQVAMNNLNVSDSADLFDRPRLIFGNYSSFEDESGYIYYEFFSSGNMTF
jgi:hypothetical protein